MTAFQRAILCLAGGLALAACGPRPGEDAPSPAVVMQAEDGFEGAWRGTLEIGAQSLRLELVLETREAGWSGELISLDQSAAGIALTAVTVEGGAIVFAVDPLSLAYEGARNGDVITGRFRQGPIAADLSFERGRFATASASAVETESEPSQRGVTIEAGAVTLSGTLRLAPGEAPGPGVVILSGSGPQDRDGTFGELRLYAALAQALAARGVSSLRLDDRGVGASTGPGPQAPSDLAADAAAALAALAAEPRVACAGFAGHSEGALIALLAAPEGQPDFIVSLAGMHMTLEQTLFDQAEALIHTSGGTDDQVAGNRALQEAMFAVLRQAQPGARVSEDMEQALLDAGAPAGLARQQAQIWGQPYAVAGFAVDPAAAAADYPGPMLGAFGEFDLQVLPAPQSEALAAARVGLPTQIVILDGVNHLFQETETGLPAEYGQARHPLSQGALDMIAQRTAALAAQACGD
ncbi:MAG: alpha/beta fold hydrolase [Alphaproteobacteria bacterium]|nr:alpha/beta fold hydrolase [Alphaproteobacteria bacterium]